MSLRHSCSIFSVQQQPPPGCCLGVFGVAAGTSARSSSTQRSPPRSPPQGQASSDVAGTSGSAPPGTARTGSEEEATPEQDQAALTWSGYVAMMRSALTNIQEDAEGQEQAPFAKVEEAMTGLMQLTYGKAEPPNPPELPREFATRWLHDDGQALHEIQLLSKITKGEQPCLQKWPGLLQELIDLQTNWKSTWKQNLEEERPGVVLNLSVHSPNREILARENRLPVALKNIVTKLHKQGSPASALAKLEQVNNLEDFNKRLKELLSGRSPIKTRLHLKDIINVLSMRFRSPRMLSGFLTEDISDHSQYQSRPKEFAVRWSLANDDISYPLYAEIVGEVDTTLHQRRKEWSDIRIVRKMQPLRLQERVSSRTHFALIQRCWRTGKRMPCPIFMSLEDPKDGNVTKASGVPQVLLCSLCKKIMVDPVTLATGQSFGRKCIKCWFQDKGHICPVTKVPVSAIVLRNERIRDYLVEWRAAEAGD
ncbi:unnamed protein product [Urochloa decumbens]|uniref:U-box domain-containing protein n=1 Tax=Urochloa decumbens TaxID=240449 RepID=A0ABC9CLA4_9POAL